MNVRENKTKILIFIVLTLGMAALWFKVQQKEFEYVPDSNLMVEFETSEEPQIAVFYPLSRNVANATDFYVRWWYQSAHDRYYLFLPAGIKEGEPYWILQEGLKVWMDEKEIKNKDKFHLSLGMHSVDIEKQGVRQRVTLEVMQSQTIPSMFIETQSGSLGAIHYQKGYTETGSYTILNPEGRVSHAGNLEKIRGRGNVSWEGSYKKAYQINLEVKTSLLSMPEEKQWILTPNAFDPSLMKNKICYDVARALEMPFTSETEYIDLYINGVYRGNYLLMEKVEVGENRVDIRDLEKETERLNEQLPEEMERFEVAMEDGGSFKGSYVPNQPEDITGGYLLEMEITERYGEKPSGFISDLGQEVVIGSPKYASYEQVSYLKNLYQEMEDAVFSESGIHPLTGKHYSEYLDMDSAVKKYIVEEVSKNLDTARSSQYLYKPQDSVSEKFYFGPVWDFDKTFGIETTNLAGVDLSVPEYIHAGTPIRESNLLYGLYQKEDFRKNLILVFDEVACPILEHEVEVEIPKIMKDISESAKMDFNRWDCFEGVAPEEKIVCFEAEVENIQDFIRQRVAFLKTEWNLTN